MREWITELAKAIFNDETGLFRYFQGEGDMSYFFNSNAKYQYPDCEHLGYFRFAGAILAKALFDKIPVPVSLNRVLLRRIIARNNDSLEVTLDDLKHYDQ